jgi:hypothetical protein
MLQALVDPALKLLSKRTAMDYEIFYASELVGNVARLLAEMISGNETFIPKRYWQNLGPLEGLSEGSWPSFYPLSFNLEKKLIDLESWPRDEDDVTLMFIQEPVLRYNFSTMVVSLQKSLLEKVVHDECVSRMTKADIHHHGRKAMLKAFNEWRTAVMNSMAVDIEMAVQGLPQAGQAGQAERRERQACLRLATDLINENRALFKHVYSCMANVNIDENRVLEEFFLHVGVGGRIPEDSRGVEIGDAAKLILEMAKTPKKTRNLTTKKMSWHFIMSGIYGEGIKKGVTDQEWLNIITEELRSLEVEYLPCTNGGKLNTRLFQKVLRPDASRLALYGQPRWRRLDGGQVFDRMACQNADMSRLFRMGALPVTSVPHLVVDGIQQTRSTRGVNPVRLQAIDEILIPASIEDPFV